MINTNERLKKLRKHLNLSQEVFGEKIGITKAAISRLESGKSNMTSRTIQAICREFNVDYLWLTTGQGDMFQQENEVIALIEERLNSEDGFVKNVFRAFAKLPAEDWRQLERILKKLIAEMNSDEPVEAKDGDET